MIGNICRYILEDILEIVKDKGVNQGAVMRLQKRSILKKNDTVLGALVKVMAIISKIPPQVDERAINPDSVDTLSDEILELTLTFCQKVLQDRKQSGLESSA